jgi:hypothetical protein
MQTLQEVRSGQLIGSKSIQLSEELTSFPTELYSFADTLEILDLSANRLKELPSGFIVFKKLRILFLSNNDFEIFPDVLSNLPALDIVGFKANKIKSISENALPKSLRWLILTDNKIAQLPASIGQCTSLQKVMLAGNSLTSLPDEMSRCVHIELLRISANQLQQIPSWIFQLPKLAWLAFAGNPCVSDFMEKEKISYTSWNTFRIQEQLGEGASGNIYKAISIDAFEVVAVKIFKGAVTSDGYPQDEMHACIHAGTHSNLVPVTSIITNHPESKAGLVFKLIPTAYKILGFPPNFETCTRDTFELNARFSISAIYTIATCIASVMSHLHVRGIAHGDLYAHNILVNNNFNSILSDFGAATIIYSLKDKTVAGFVEKIDVRAFGCLLDDLLQRTDSDKTQELTILSSLKNACLIDDIHIRPTFKDILNTIAR